MQSLSGCDWLDMQSSLNLSLSLSLSLSLFLCMYIYIYNTIAAALQFLPTLSSRLVCWKKGRFDVFPLEVSEEKKSLTLTKKSHKNYLSQENKLMDDS